MDSSPLIALQEFLDRLKDTPAGDLMKRADDLRRYLIRTSIVFFVIFLGVVSFAKPMFNFLKSPLTSALPAGQATLHFTDPLEVFLCYIKVGFLAAVIVTAPYGFMQLWRFIGPSLPERQRGYVVPFFTISMMLFLGGCAFCFYFMLPATLEILISMSGDVATPMITVDEYISVVVLMMLGFGAVFQLPLVLIILERLGVINAQMLASNRGGMLVGILVVAAVATPPDPFSQLAMATPMYLMFEVAILVIRWLEKQDKKPLPPARPST